MAKKAAPKPAETETATEDSTISKSEAARQALAAGLEGPEEATAFIKKTFGIEMSKSHFSAVKSQIKAKAAGGTAAPKAKPGRKPKATLVQLDQVVKTIQPAVGKSVIADLAAVKALVERLGVEEVKSIAELFG